MILDLELNRDAQQNAGLGVTLAAEDLNGWYGTNVFRTSITVDILNFIREYFSYIDGKVEENHYLR